MSKLQKKLNQKNLNAQIIKAYEAQNLKLKIKP